MPEIRRILMCRDGMTRREANKYMRKIRKQMNTAITCKDFYEAERIFEDGFGLECEELFEQFI